MSEGGPRTARSIRYLPKTLAQISELQTHFKGISRDGLIANAIDEMHAKYIGGEAEIPVESEPQEFLTLAQLADKWDVSQQTIYNWVRADRLKPTTNSNGNFIFSIEEIEAITPPKPRAKRAGKPLGE